MNVTSFSVRTASERVARARLSEVLQPYWFLLPAAAYLVALLGYPLVRGILLSLTDTSLTNPFEGSFVGSENYSVVSSVEFWTAIRLTLVYTVGCVVGAVGLGLGVALLVNRKFAGRGIFRAALIFPWATPTVAAVLVFDWILNGQYGVANHILSALGIVDDDPAWLTDPSWAMPIVILVTVWMIFPFSALVLLSALQSVPDDLYEAARLDGANSAALFRNVTLPSIAPSAAVLVLFVTIWSIRRFEVIWLLTGGGPQDATGTLVIDLYKEGFVDFQLGKSAAYGVLGLILSAIVTVAFFLVYKRIGRRTGVEI